MKIDVDVVVRLRYLASTLRAAEAGLRAARTEPPIQQSGTALPRIPNTTLSLRTLEKLQGLSADSSASSRTAEHSRRSNGTSSSEANDAQNFQGTESPPIGAENTFRPDASFGEIVPPYCQDSGPDTRQTSLPSSASLPGSSHQGTKHSRHGSNFGLQRNLANIAGEFPVEGSGARSNDHASEETSEFQDPMWLMAGLAERGWTLQKSSDGKRKSASGGLLTSTALHGDEERRLLHGWTSHYLQALEKEQSRYYQHGNLGSKCDVAEELDPIQRGLISEERALHLFGV